MPHPFTCHLNAHARHGNHLAGCESWLSLGAVAPYDAGDQPITQRDAPMDIRPITPSYAVSPQITPADLAAIKAAGYTTIINNRPDGEIPPDLHSDAMRAAVEGMGLTFIANPVIGGAMTADNVTAQGAAIAAATGPVFAYCASGNRSSVVWALSQAGTRPADELVGLPAQFGYQLDHLRPQIAALAAQKG
jgi:uncharacterized protein (TIGR01244 family)